ncbi:MAG: hypothetical protein IJW41_05185 [Oscillospiraceae bacterium]|nr:hypothetical protein [Oscillospiraceae bacterium]MBQ7341542.1 hypothetical protein [Oscillospiraceae bacterium]
MKKIIALVLALVLSLSLVACGGGSADAPKVDNSKIAAYIEANKADLVSSMESSFATSSGMTCTSDIKVEGMGFVMTININELDEVDAATKDLLQETYDAMDSVFESALETMQKDLPEIEYFEVVVCEVDGDVLATVTAGNK